MTKVLPLGPRPAWALSLVAGLLGCEAATGDVLSRRDKEPPALALRAGAPPLSRVGRTWRWPVAVEGALGPVEADVAVRPLLPVRLELESGAGAVELTPRQAGQVDIEVSVEDGEGRTATASVTLDVRPPLVATATPARPGMVGRPYSGALAGASGGRPPYQWSVDPAALPPGLAIDPAEGTLSGVPEGAGAFELVVDVTDVEGDRDAVPVRLRVDRALAIRPPPELDVPLGSPVEWIFEAAGGVPPYRWTLDGPLPAGVAVTSTRGPALTAAGTAGEPGRFPVELELTDGLDRTVRRAVSPLVSGSGAPLVIEGPRAFEVRGCRPFEAELRATGGGGVGTEWRVELPEGLVAEASGRRLRVAGLLRAPGTATAQISMTEASGLSASAELVLDVGPLDTEPLGAAGRWFLTRDANVFGQGDRCEWPPIDQRRQTEGPWPLTPPGRFADRSGGPGPTQLTLLTLGPGGLSETVVHTSTRSFFSVDVYPPIVDGDTLLLEANVEIPWPELGRTVTRRRVFALRMAPGEQPRQILPNPSVQIFQELEAIAPNGPFVLIEQSDEPLVVNVDTGEVAPPACPVGSPGGAARGFVSGTPRPTVLYRCGDSTWVAEFSPSACGRGDDGSCWRATRVGDGAWDVLSGPWLRSPSAGQVLSLADPARTRYPAASPEWASLGPAGATGWLAGIYEAPRDNPLDARNEPGLFLTPLPPPSTGPTRIAGSFGLRDVRFREDRVLTWRDGQDTRLLPLPPSAPPVTLSGVSGAPLVELGGGRWLAVRDGATHLLEVGPGGARSVWSQPGSLRFAVPRVDRLGVWFRDQDHDRMFLDLFSGAAPRVITATTAAAWPRFWVRD